MPRADGAAVSAMIVEQDTRQINGWLSIDAGGQVLTAGGIGDRLAGWDADSLRGRQLDALLHPDDRIVLDDVVRRVLDHGWEQVVQVRLRSSDGRWLRMEATMRGVGNEIVVADLLDVSARYARTEGLASLAEIRRAMHDADDESEAWRAALDRLAERGGFASWARWMPAADPDRTTEPWGRRPVGSAESNLVDAVATAARTGRWGWAHDLTRDGSLSAADALLVPVTSGDDVLAVVEFGQQHRLVDDAAIALVVEVAAQLGDAVERHRADRAAREERQRAELAFDEAAIGMLLVDDDARVVRANAACCALLARTEAQLIAEDLHAIVHPEDLDLDRSQRRQLIAGGLDHYQIEKRFVRPDGSIVWGLLTVSLAQGAGGTPAQFILQIQDVGDRRTAQIALERTVALFAAAFDGAATGMVLVGLDGPERSMIAASNARFRTLCAHLGLEEPPQRFDEFSPGADRWLQQVGDDDHLETAVSERAVGGPLAERWVRLSAAPVNTGEVDHRFVLVHVEDITEQHVAQAELAYNALHDALTGLPNRALISERIRHAQERSERTGAHVGVLFIDLDNFKDVNDSLGHHAGDELLREVALRFATSIRPSDTAARLGGDEFVILCEDLDGDPAVALVELSEVATRLHESLEGGVEFELGEGWVSASIGLQVVRGASQSVTTLLGNADVAMYRAKANGRSRTEVFDAAMRRAAIERVHIAAELRRATDRGQMWCEYQPIVRLRDGRVTGAEALLRWQHPELGLVSPSRFIDVAEESDLIVELGEFVVDAVCRTAAAMPSLGYVTMNVSARQLAQSNFSKLLLHALDRHGLDPSRIAVELTENVLMDAGGSSLRQLVELRRAGLPIGVDDFGTGFASLTYLRKLPVTFVKIDKSFVDGILDDPEDRTIVDGTIGLAHSLGLALIAEGVETVEQAALLADLGCECGQGFLFSRPTTDVAEVLIAGRRLEREPMPATRRMVRAH